MNADSAARIEPFVAGLKQYCLTLAKNEWDAQDLMQETLAKVYRSIQQAPDRELTKAYFYRVARNRWIDHCRKTQASGTGAVFDEQIHRPASGVFDELSIRETFEQLAGSLNPRQMVLILLMDIFQFTAPETAQLLRTTIGAVKEGLKRARQRLQSLAALSNNTVQTSKHKAADHVTGHTFGKEMFEQFLAGFRAGDAEAITRSYLALAENGIHVDKESGTGGRFYFNFRDPNGHMISFFQDI